MAFINVSKKACNCFSGIRRRGGIKPQPGLICWSKDEPRVFVQHERDNAHAPLPKGPLVSFAKKLSDIQAHFGNLSENCPIRTALVTSRASPAHERAIQTLRSLGLELDHTLFLGGRDKGPFLSAFGADIFFDDMHQNCLSASDHQVSAAHVPNGCRNVESDSDK